MKIKTPIFYLMSLFLVSCMSPRSAEREQNPISPSLKPSETGLQKATEENPGQDRPRTSREFRAAWIATVANINWPSEPGLSVKEQQEEAIKLLDTLKNNNFNAVIFQVRPQADALYQSALEPWSYYLTGQQGKAPEPFYDPLNFWIEAAHDRGLELHAWLNPYRAHHTSGGEISSESVIKTDPDLVVELENGMWWMDPGKEETKERSINVVMDLIRRYDLDGIHFDDYFYPYPSYNNNKDFPDKDSWNEYVQDNGMLNRSDWRRENVNEFIQTVYQKIKEVKPHVKFGLSPFGIWRPGYPESIAGYDQYEQLYADARLWLKKGWIDYFTPQLYWKINARAQSFPVLLGWWSKQNKQKRHLWPGINIGLGGDEKNVDETINQIMITRGMLENSPGVIHWSIAPLMKHSLLTEGLLEGPYSEEALVPRTPWLDNQSPKAPVVVAQKNGDSVKLDWIMPKNSEKPFKFVVYFRYGNSWDYDILDRNETSYNLASFLHPKHVNKIPLKEIAVTSVDRLSNESSLEKKKLEQEIEAPVK